jgi:hypothetical protein
MVTALSIAVAGLLLTEVFFAVWVVNLRARLFNQAAKRRSLKAEPDTPPSSGAAPLPYDDEMEIPAALVGARCKQVIERFAPVLGTTPVQLLRAALVAGLTGDRPITTEMLDVLDQMGRASKRAPRGKPGSSRTH